MSLVGNLEDLPLADILQIVSLSKRTGILTIETDEGKNIVVFKNGLIVSAACPSPKIKNLGQILLERKILSQSKLQNLLETQKTRGNEPLGSIVLEAGIIDKDTLQQIVTTQIRETIFHLMGINEGSFSFDLSEVIPFDDIRYNPLESALERGLNPQQLLLDSARISDEQRRDEEQENAMLDGSEADLQIPTSSGGQQNEDDQILSYEQMVSPSPAVPKEEITLQDLQLPESAELPDINFQMIAEQIEIPTATPSLPQDYQLLPQVTPAVLTRQQTILLVDDEALIRQVMAARLKEKGFHVVQCDNPGSAIHLAREMLQENDNLWIISDLVMPTTVGNGFLGGLELVETIRRTNSTIPIIVITDYEDPKAQTRAFSLGVHNFHRKPLLSKTTVKDAETQLHRFSDELVEAFRQPPHQFKQSELEEDFWSDLGIERPKEETSSSASNMVRQMTALRQIITELRNPNEAPEISLLILRYAAEFFDRGLLFLIKKQEVDGLGGFGDTGEAEGMPQKVRRIKIPLSEESIFSKIVKRKQTHIGKLSDTPTNRRFISMTGRLIPASIAMLPLISGNEVIAMLYGDNAVTKKPIKDLEGLEIFMVQAGIAMENALLHRKIKSLKFK